LLHSFPAWVEKKKENPKAEGELVDGLADVAEYVKNCGVAVLAADIVGGYRLGVAFALACGEQLN
jgi:hypothetical protein